MTPFLQFEPIYQERVWGGRELEAYLGRKLPAAGPIGESWELVDRVEAQSVVRGGPWAGQSLRQVIAGHAEEVMGPGWAASRRRKTGISARAMPGPLFMRVCGRE